MRKEVKMAICDGCAVFSPLVYIEAFSKPTKKCQFCKKELAEGEGIIRIRINEHEGTLQVFREGSKLENV
jgi:hypothetical protein